MTMQRSTQLIIAGILMLIASPVSLILGLLLLDSYNSSIGHKYISYAALTGGILNLTAFPLELVSGAFLIIKKFKLSVLMEVVVLVIGFTSPLILRSQGYLLETGLLFGSPMIVSSTIVLVLALLGQRSRN
jgi:hypothetical protein